MWVNTHAYSWVRCGDGAPIREKRDIRICLAPNCVSTSPSDGAGPFLIIFIDVEFNKMILLKKY